MIMKTNKDKLIIWSSIFFIIARILYKDIMPTNKLILYFMDTISICSIISLIMYTINLVRNKAINYVDIWIINYLVLLLILIMFPETSISIGLVMVISVLIIVPLIIIPFLYFILFIRIKKIYLEYSQYFRNRFIITLLCIVLNIINILKSVILFKTKL